MKKRTVLTISIFMLLALPLVLAQVTIPSDGIQNRFKLIADDFQIRTGINLTSLNESEILLVRGSNLNFIESSLFTLLELHYPVLKQVEQMTDDPANIVAVQQSPKQILLYGGPSQNKIARFYGGLLSNPETVTYEDSIVVTYTPSADKKIVTISDLRGYGNLAREGLAYSPLQGIVPEPYIPAASTTLSLLLLTLFQFAQTYIENYLQFQGSKHRTINPQFLGIQIGTIELRVRELISIFVAACIFAVSVTWNFAGGTTTFASLLLLNIALCTTIYYVQEFIRMAVAWWEGFNTEYIVYPVGCLVTIVSGVLGSPFGTSGLLLTENAESKETIAKAGRIAYLASTVVFTLGLLFFFINVISPTPLWQMALNVSSTVAFFTFLPINPLNGKSVYDWNKNLWMGTFSIMLIIYFLINFIL